jgi:hypothetical protein
MAALATGDRVRLQGLISRSDLNGSIACILEASTPDERQSLEIQGRIKVTGLSNVGVPKSLAVKRENAVSLGDTPVDWTFCDSPQLSLLELVRARGTRVFCLRENAAVSMLALYPIICSELQFTCS